MGRGFWLGWLALVVVVGLSVIAPPTDLEPEAASVAVAVDSGRDAQQRTLLSLERIDDHPLYRMTYYGVYGSARAGIEREEAEPAWACSLFVSKGGEDGRLFGRNFDWPHHPALLLFTDPPGGYASVSMVDLSFLFSPEDADRLDDLPLDRLAPLLETPFWTFDGMNEQGLAIGMAAVAESAMPFDPQRRTVSSLGFMREVLDRAASVDEALDILASVNIDMSGGPCLHYLVADRAGAAALIEFRDGETAVMQVDGTWAAATNVRLGWIPEEERAGICERLDRLTGWFEAAEGGANAAEAMSLLDDVHQSHPDHPEFGTQWSVVYGLDTGMIYLAMEHRYDETKTFELPIGDL